MTSSGKVVVALVAIVLVAAIALFVINQNAGEPVVTATTTNEQTIAPQEQTAQTQSDAQPQESTQPELTAEASAGSTNQQAQDDAQGTLYEGVLAGLSEEEIAAMALAEEQSQVQEEADAEGVQSQE